MGQHIGISRYVMDSGERSCLVVDRSTGLPLYYPNLYLTTQLRNRSVAFATIEAEACHIVVLLRYLDLRNVDIETRFSKKQFLIGHELDDLRDFTQRKQRKFPSEVSNDSMFSIEELQESVESVTNSTQYARLTAVANYLSWFARYLLDTAEQEVTEQIDAMSGQIKVRRPQKKRRNDEGVDKSLSDNQLDVLFEVVRPGSD
ncbi:MAG: tyrosine-type recombinase/integrase, partial [bacterium]